MKFQLRKTQRNYKFNYVMELFIDSLVFCWRKRDYD